MADIICLFSIVVIVGFVHGKTEAVFQKTWVAWVLIILLILFFVYSASTIFSWAININQVSGWLSSDWFGSILLIIIAAVVAAVVSRK